MQQFVGVPSCYPQLVELRKSKTAAFKQNKHLKETTKLRYYQVIGSLHMLMLERMVLGDSTGLGKTIIFIAAHTWILDKNPNVKVLVVTNKSATSQWQEEYEKFTNGITVRIIANEYNGLTGYNARKLQYEQFKEHVMIVGYATIRNEYEAIREALGNENYVICYDECFEYHTPIILEDGTTELIGKIVSQKKQIKVLSFNKTTNKVESKKVISFFRTPMTEWLIIKGKRTNSSICSPNHKYITIDGEKHASELKVGDTIYGVDRGYSDTQKQIILGSILGDGGIANYKQFINDKPTGMVLMQSSKKSQYIFFKTQILSEHIERVWKQKEGWNRYPVWYIYTYSNPIMLNYLKSMGIVNTNGKKQITRKVLDSLSPIGIAIWYCDDGSFCNNRMISLNTQCFTKRENKIIIDYFLEKWGIEFKPCVDKCKKNGNLHYIRTGVEGVEKFLRIISPYIPKSMGYKTNLPCGSFWDSYYEKPFWDTYTDEIEICEKKKFSKGTFAKFKYNIEVEDNHNYFAGGVLVSNCVAFKNRKADTHFAASYLSEHAKRVYGLSATIIKNGLEEVYGIYAVIVPGLFGRITKFKDTYCQQKMMRLVIGGKPRMIPKITGYKNLAQFKQVLDPYFLIRRKEEVATELPKLISKKVVLEMYPEQKALYKQALAGIIYEEKVKQEFFEISDKIRQGSATDKDLELFKVRKEKYDKFSTEEGKKRGKLAALTYCQMISNGPSLVNQPGESSKEDEFLRLMKEELLTEKVILYTRFASGIPSLEVVCERNRIAYVKITGSDSDSERQKARHKFQNDPNCNLIFITNAGSASLNLQSAGCIIFYDTPWSYGDLAQTIGRAQRIGSIKDHILLLHLVNKGSIDMRVINKVTDKKDLSDQILGDTAEGALDFTSTEANVVDDLYSGLLEDANK